MPIKSTPDVNVLKATLSEPMPPGTAQPSTNSASPITQPLQSNASGPMQTDASTELASNHMQQPTPSQTFNSLPEQQQIQRRFSSTAAPPAAPTHSYKPHSSSGNGSSSSSIEHTTTPLVWLVVWSVACAGFLVGYASGANVAVAQVFRQVFLPQLVRRSSKYIPSYPPSCYHTSRIAFCSGQESSSGQGLPTAPSVWPFPSRTVTFIPLQALLVLLLIQ